MRRWNPWIALLLGGCLGFGCSSEPAPTGPRVSELQQKAENSTATIADWKAASPTDQEAYITAYTQKRLGAADEKHVKELTDYLNAFVKRMSDPSLPTVAEAIMTTNLELTIKTGTRLMGWPPATATASAHASAKS